MRSIQEIPFSHMKKFIKTVFEELKNRIYVYAGIVAVLVLITLTSKFDGWEGLTAVGTLSMAFAVFFLEILLPYIKRPRLTLTFSQEDKKCCREAQIVEWETKETESKLKQKSEISYEVMPSEQPLEELHEIIPPSAVLTTPVGTSPTSLSSYVDIMKVKEAAKEISISKKKGYFIRIKVQNTGGTLAKKCQGVIAEVHLIKGDLDETEYFVPLILHWANRSPRLCREPLDLNTGAHWYLDVAYTKKGSESLTVFHIFAGEPLGTIDKFKKGEYRFRIIIYAEGTKPAERWLKLKWEGNDYKDVEARLE